MKSLRLADKRLREDAAVFELPRSFFYLDNLRQKEYIKSAFKRLCKQHPDKGGDSDAFREIIEARNRLNYYIDKHNSISIHNVYNAYLIEKKITAEQFISGKYRLQYNTKTTINGKITDKKKSKTIVIDNVVHITFGEFTFHYFQEKDSEFGDIYFVKYPAEIVSHNSKLYYALQMEISQNDVRNREINIAGIQVRFNSDIIRKHNQIVGISEFRALFLTVIPIIKLNG